MSSNNLFKNKVAKKLFTNIYVCVHARVCVCK